MAQPLSRNGEILAVLAALPNTPAVHVDLLSALTRGIGDTDEVLTDLADTGAVERIGSVEIMVTEAGRRTVEPVDPPRLRRAVLWYTTQAISAERAIHPHSQRLASLYEHPAQHFTDPASAVDWYQRNRGTLLGLLPLGLEQRWYELTWQLAEAVWGLAQYNGTGIDERDSQVIGLQALTALHRQRSAVTHARIAFGHSTAGAHDRAIDEADIALEYALGSGDPIVLSTVLATRGRADHAAGRHRLALQDLRSALVHAERTGDQRSIALRHHHIGAAQGALGETRQAVRHLEFAVALLTELDDQVGRARVLTELATVLLDSGEHERAEEHLRDAVATTRQAGARLYTAEILELLGRCAETRHDPDAAHTHVTEAMDLYVHTGHSARIERLRARQGRGATSGRETDKPRNERLIAWREATPSPADPTLCMSRAELAAAADDYLKIHHPEYVGVTDGEIGRYERRVVNFPSEPRRDAVRFVLSGERPVPLTDAELGFFHYWTRKKLDLRTPPTAVRDR